MKKNDIEIIHAYIGYSDGSGSKEGWRAEYCPEMPEYVLMFLTSMYAKSRLPEEILNKDNIIQFHPRAYGNKMTRQQVIDFINSLEDESEKQPVLEKLAQIKETATFMLVTEGGNNAGADINDKEYMDKQLGHKTIEDCIQFRNPVPICRTQFPVSEPDVELGYVRGVFTGIDCPFFAKLWRSKQNGLKYVTLVFDYGFFEESKRQIYEAEKFMEYPLLAKRYLFCGNYKYNLDTCIEI